MDTAHFSKPLVQNLSAQSSLTRAGTSSNNQHFDCFRLLRKHSTSAIHSCQDTTASCNCTGYPLGREDGRPVRKPQVLGTRYGYVCAVKNSTVMPALQLCRSSCSETLLYFLSVLHQQLRAPTARKGILYFRALAHDEAGLRDHQAKAGQ